MPDSNTFHADIAWLADAGVTKGCNPPANTQFCPDDNVTRGQMAAFMNRFAGYIGATDGTPAQADRATTAGDADTLDGKNGTAYETRVAADGCHLNSNASATSCGDDDAGTVPDQITREHASVTVNAPTSGTLQIDGYVITNSAMWFTLNESCATYNPADFVPRLRPPTPHPSDGKVAI